MKRIFPVFLCVLLCLVCTLLPAFASSDPDVQYETTYVDDEVKDYSESSLADLINGLFGTYTPRTQTVVVHYEDGSVDAYNEVIPGLAGLDWNWIACFVLFTVTMFCVLKMIGGLLKWT